VLAMPKVHRQARPQAGCVVVHCSDRRYQKHFHQFLRRNLRLEQYALVAVPGAVQFLARSRSRASYSRAGHGWMSFLGDLTHPKRLVLISHDDCRWYFSLPGLRSARRVRARQFRDLRRVRSALRKRFSGAHVELYFARRLGSRCSFQKVR